METNKKIKTTFLRKFLVSIFGIEKYEQVAESTVPSFIKYLFILAIIASILIVPSVIQITVKATDTFQNFVNENLPNFEIVNNEFKLESNETIIRTNKTDFQKIIQGTIILTNENDIKSNTININIYIYHFFYSITYFLNFILLIFNKILQISN